MQTPTHFLTSALIERYLPETGIPKHTTAFLVGALLPDLPFTLLTVLYEIYCRWFAELPQNPYSSIMKYLHFDLFFNDPIWIIGHNTLHSLIVNLVLICVGYLALKHHRRWGVMLFWLAAGMLLHTIIDIFTHTSDGPLMFFPLNWIYRFPSPVSYWEADHFGQFVVVAEYTVNGAILVYFFVRWRRQYHRQAN